MENYITIAEFAERVGVSKQAIYKRISKDLAPYLKEEGRVKYIAEEATALFNHSTNQPRLKQTKVERVEKVELDQDQETTYLLEQLKEKDRLIQEQQQTIKDQAEQIKKLQDHIISQATETTEILKKQSQLQENFQILLGQQQQQLQAGSQETTVETVETTVKQTEVERVEKVEPQKKPGFFSRLFR